MRWFDQIANSARYIRLQREIDQATAATESGISLRTVQNIEAGKPVNASSLFTYLEFLGLLPDMLATLPDPNKPTPMELLSARKEGRKRVRSAPARKASFNTDAGETGIAHRKRQFKWGDEQ